MTLSFDEVEQLLAALVDTGIKQLVYVVEV